MARLKALLYALLAFFAATSFSVGEGGAILLRLPPLDTLISHVDLYASGLVVAVEFFSRVVPSTAHNSFLTGLVQVANALIPDRAHGGGSHILEPVLNGAPV
jgi:hypothetical protein